MTSETRKRSEMIQRCILHVHTSSYLTHGAFALARNQAARTLFDVLVLASLIGVVRSDVAVRTSAAFDG